MRPACCTHIVPAQAPRRHPSPGPESVIPRIPCWQLQSGLWDAPDPSPAASGEQREGFCFLGSLLALYMKECGPH